MATGSGRPTSAISSNRAHDRFEDSDSDYDHEQEHEHEHELLQMPTTVDPRKIKLDKFSAGTRNNLRLRYPTFRRKALLVVIFLLPRFMQALHPRLRTGNVTSKPVFYPKDEVEFELTAEIIDGF